MVYAKGILTRVVSSPIPMSYTGILDTCMQNLFQWVIWLAGLVSIKANYLNSCCKNIVDIFITVLMSKLKNWTSQHWDKIMNVGAELLGWVCVFAVHWNMNLFRWLIFQWPTAKTVQQSKARAQPEYVVLFILCTVNVEYYVQSIVHCNVYCLQYWEYTV